MRQVTITVDTTTWERFNENRKIINRNTINDIIRCFQDGVDIAKEMMQPHLRIVGQERTKEIKQNTSNIARIGLPPTETEVKLNIEDALYEDIVWAAERRSMSPKEYMDKRASDYMDICLPEVTDITKAIYAGLGLEIIEVVK
jgi:hypothetical protein